MTFLDNAFNIIRINENSGLFSIHFNKNHNDYINLNCKNIKLSDKDISDNDISLDFVLNKTKSKAKYLFSENISTKTILDKYNFENFVTIQSALEQGFYSKEINTILILV